MELTLKRIAKKLNYTIGKLYINGIYECDTLEDRDRGLDASMSLETINKIKVKNETAIPTGTYAITLNTVSPRFGGRAQYSFCNGKLPRLLNVKGYDGVLIHIGNTDKDSSGCILVGQNKKVGQVINSTATFRNLYTKIDAANRKGEKIIIKITN